MKKNSMIYKLNNLFLVTSGKKTECKYTLTCEKKNCQLKLNIFFAGMFLSFSTSD